MLLPTVSAEPVPDALPAEGQGGGNPVSGANGVVRPETRNLSIAQVKRIFRQQIQNPKPFTMVSRNDWGAARARAAEMEPMGPVNGIVLHHTANPEVATGCPERWKRIRNIQRGQVRNLEYADISYHYLIAKGCDGRWRIIEGRDPKYKGAHAGGRWVKVKGKLIRRNMNDGKIGIAFSANFEDPNPARPAATSGGPPAAALEQLAILMAKLKRENPRAEVLAHGGPIEALALQKRYTSCPGDHMAASLRAAREVFGNVGRRHEGVQGVDWL